MRFLAKIVAIYFSKKTKFDRINNNKDKSAYF